MCIFAVTPLVGVWIEIMTAFNMKAKEASLPLWECGLKLFGPFPLQNTTLVTPLVGVWIEILDGNERRGNKNSHSPCGSVD